MIHIFNEILSRPLFNVLVFIYNLLPGQDFGLAIIVLTLIIRLIFTPLSVKALRSQKAISQIQPQIKDLQKKFGDNKQALAEATMALYKEAGVNPLSGCLPLLIQIPVLIALYQALISGLKPSSLSGLYSFIHNPGAINTVSLGIFNLVGPNRILAVTAGVLQLIQAWQASKIQAKSGMAGNQMGAMMSKQMLYIFPFMVIIIAWNLPTGLVFYWIFSTLFSIFEQIYTNKKR